MHQRAVNTRKHSRLCHRRRRPIPVRRRAVSYDDGSPWTIELQGKQLKVAVELDCPLGRLQVASLQADDIKAAAVMVTRSFADSNWQSIDGIQSYLSDVIGDSPNAAVLVARLFPTEGSSFFVPEGRTHRIVGLAELSFSESTRDDFEAQGDPPVPDDSTYLSNMSVDQEFRRSGIGKSLVTVCEAVSQTVATQRSSLSLHVQSSNTSAVQFYSSLGFSTTGENSPLRALRGKIRHKAMVKPL